MLSNLFPISVRVVETSLNNESVMPRGFASEERLVSAFEKSIYHVGESEEWHVLKEFDSANGIADVVVCRLAQYWKDELAIGEIAPRWAYALYCIPYQHWFTVAEFAEICGVTPQRAKIALKQYAAAGFCEESSVRKSWIKLKQPQPLANDIHAIEAKLRDWKRALWQASRYRDYATQCWVLLDEFAIKPASANLKEFERLNIGLAGLATDGRMQILYRPTPLPPKSALSFWHANAEIAHRLRSSF